MKKNIYVFFAACAGMLLFGVSLITLGSVATSLKAKFFLDGLATGTLFSILPLGILAGSLIFGPVCDRFGYKLLLIAACVVMFAGFEGIAYANTLGALKIGVFAFGLGGGIINGATNAVVADISTEKKAANLSLLGVFFGVGALGMPLVLGWLSERFQSLRIVAVVGWLTLIVALFYCFVTFPPAKQKQNNAVADWKKLFRWLLLLIALFLFFQSSFEAIVNNWATTYLTSQNGMKENRALYALSIHIAGMVCMRLLTGSLFRNVSPIKILWVCLGLLLAGILLMHFGKEEFVIITGMFLSGAGLAGGFPIMLGFAGDRFPELSGTAFSFIFTIALIGNILVNYLMGHIVHKYGVNHLTTVAYIEIALMSVLFIFIIQKLKPSNRS
jgi:MFS family permease